MFGDGSQTRSFCYVSDLIEGFLRLIDSDHHEPVNIGNPGEFTILELAETIIRAHRQPLGDRLRGPARRTTPRCAGRTSPWRSELLGWEPTIELEEGLRLTLAAMGPRGRRSPAERTPRRRRPAG